MSTSHRTKVTRRSCNDAGARPRWADGCSTLDAGYCSRWSMSSGFTTTRVTPRQQKHDGLRIALDAVISHSRSISTVSKACDVLRRRPDDVASSRTHTGARVACESCSDDCSVRRGDRRCAVRRSCYNALDCGCHADEGPAISMSMATCGDTPESMSCGKGGACKIAASCRLDRLPCARRRRATGVSHPVTSHDSLSAWLQPIAKRLRDASVTMSESCSPSTWRRVLRPARRVRDVGIEFVTYERAPIPRSLRPHSIRTVVVRGEIVSAPREPQQEPRR